MSALDTARAAAAKAADALRNAEAKAAAEAEAVRQRNAERRAAFWSDAGEQCMALRTSADAHLVTARQLVAKGEPATALDAYAAYRFAYAAWQAVAGSAAHATTRYVDDHDLEVDATTYGARRVLPHGVPGEARRNTAPAPWATVLEDGLQTGADAHAHAFADDYLAPLRSSLEPEPEL